MCQRFGHGDAHRAVQCRLAIETVRRVLAETGAGPGRKPARIGGMGLQQDMPVAVAHNIGNQFPVGAQRGKPLGQVLFLAVDDVADRQRQDALRRFLKGGIKDLAHLTLKDDHCHRSRRNPQKRQQDPKRQPKPGHQASRPSYARPDRWRTMFLRIWCCHCL